jgi:hypothetical protein
VEELDQWKAFEQAKLLPEPLESDASHSINDQIISQLQSTSIMKQQLSTTTSYIDRLPIAVDSFDWSLQIAATFVERSKDFCEDIFRQIFARFFAEDARSPPIDPLLVLKAMSSKAQQQQQQQGARRQSLRKSTSLMTAVLEYH